MICETGNQSTKKDMKCGLFKDVDCYHHSKLIKILKFLIAIKKMSSMQYRAHFCRFYL